MINKYIITLLTILGNPIFAFAFWGAWKQRTDESWRQLLYLAHTDQKQAFNSYADYYLSTSGQIDRSDLHQLDVPSPALAGFLEQVREDFRKNETELIYGTVRLIARDDEIFSPWAKQPHACAIAMAARRGATSYLTYRYYAT